MPGLDQLEVIGPTGDVSFYNLDSDKGITNIGRHPDNDIVIDSPSVGLFHAVIDHRKKPFRITLINDGGGMWLDGTVLTSPGSAHLHNWATIELDGHKLILIEDASNRVIDTFRPPVPVAEKTKAELAPQEEAKPKPPEKKSRIPVEEYRLDNRPPDQEDEYLRFSLKEREWITDVEQPATFMFTVVNAGPLVVDVEVRIEGIAPEWMEISPTKMQLQEGHKKRVTVSITPPREPSSRAGPHHLAVIVTSSDYPGHKAKLGGTLIVTPYYKFSVKELSPKQQTLSWRKTEGEAELEIVNWGNSPTAFRLEASDNEHACEFEFEVPDETSNNKLVKRASPVDIDVLPEHIFNVPIHITPLKRPFIGLSKQIHSFTVTTTMLAGEQTPWSQPGQIKVRPRIGPFVIISTLLLFSVLCVLLFNPSIHTFNAAPGQIQEGQKTTLSWEAKSFANLTLESDTGEVEGFTGNSRGQITVDPTDTTTYYLRSRNLLSRLPLLPRLFDLEKKTTVTVDVLPPNIAYFSANKTEIVTGEEVTLRWKVENAKEVTLNGQTLPEEEYVYEMDVKPLPENEATQKVVYDLVAVAKRNHLENKTDKVTILVMTPTPTPMPLPEVKKFTVLPSTIFAGENVTLTWETDKATHVMINDQQYPYEGETVQTLDEVGSVEFILRAVYQSEENPEAKREADYPPKLVIVKEKPPEPEDPEIEFAVSPAEIEYGKSATLIWNVQNAESIKIEGPTLGTVENLDLEGQLTVWAESSTFFILTAYNADKKDSSTIELKVGPPPTPTPPPPRINYFTLRSITPGQAAAVDPTNNRKYLLEPGTQVALEWLVRNAPNATLRFENANGQIVQYGEFPPENLNFEVPGTMQANGKFVLKADDEEGENEVTAEIEVQVQKINPPPPVCLVQGPTVVNTPSLQLTWNYTFVHANYLKGFRVYRGDQNTYTFTPVQTSVEDLIPIQANKTSYSWTDTSETGLPWPVCDLIYEIAVVYENELGEIHEVKCEGTAGYYQTARCPTPTPKP